MQSMSGFGHASGVVGGLEISVEIKTLNSRFLDIAPRIPKELMRLETAVKKTVQSMLRRGRVELYLNASVVEGDQYVLNENLVENFLSLARRAGVQGVQGGLEVGTLLQLPGVLTPKEADISTGDEAVLAIVHQALEMAGEERRREGARLRSDLSQRLSSLEEVVRQIKEQSQGLIEHYRDKLNQRIERLSAEQPLDPARLAQEVLFYAERADISEELARLQSHLIRFRQQLDAPAGESVGKRLDFLCQELNRESNTVLSKAQLPGMSALALEAKTEVEKLREQVQNVE